MGQRFYLTHQLTGGPVRYYNLFKGEFEEHTYEYIGRLKNAEMN